MQFRNFLLVASALSLVAAQQCAVCPTEIGPDTNGDWLALSGASAQLGAPTFCM
ncbi:hypothetical protein EXIGLDRAFT_717238 [Exidia glandulosa HHB12029]|uniref:Uncharacterized protein n=1 Tax=Exidia glandulosa HHB12029 TaxID=1314781 RepID=A0A165P4U7_EXIGL|nr:hypothetical protein EXIGLDRAFT_717238 [Exidia glandulosa HHB12029]